MGGMLRFPCVSGSIRMAWMRNNSSRFADYGYSWAVVCSWRRGGVVVWSTSVPETHIRMILSLVFGPESSRDFTVAVDNALAAAARRGVSIEDEGWTRAVDVPEDSSAHPATAAELGLR